MAIGLGCGWTLPLAFVVLTACGGSSSEPCETARKKLDSCHSQIQSAVERSGSVSLPLTFSGECSGLNRCTSECAADVGCAELARVIAGGSTDPNAPPDEGSLLRCVLACMDHG